MNYSFVPSMVIAVVCAGLGLWGFAAINIAISALFAVVIRQRNI